MSSLVQSVTVAIVDADHKRRAAYERLLQGESGITLLTNIQTITEASNDADFVNRRLKPRTNLSTRDNEVARIKRLKPLILLVNLNLCADEDYALLLSLHHECPEVVMISLVDDSVSENQILQILEIGTRGYLKNNTAPLYLSKAIKVVGRGEAWVSRKMLGNIMNHMMN